MGLFDGLLGGGGGGADDPYADILTPAQRNHMQAQGLLAMAGALAQAGMPSRLPVPLGSALGSAAAALGTGQEAGMKTAIENALAAQKVRDLRTTAEFRKQFFGDQDKLYQAIQGVIGPGGTAAPASTRSAGATPPAGTSAGPGTAPGAGGGLLSPDLSLPSDTNPDYFTRGMTAPGAGGVGRFDASGGLLNYPAATDGMGVGGVGLISQAPFDPTGFQTKVPSSEYEPGGLRYPFKDLGVVPGGAGGGGAGGTATTAPSAGATPNAETQIPGAYYDATEGLKVPGMPGYDPSRAGKAPPPVTPTPGPTNGIDPRRRAALDAILSGIQTAQAGPAAQRLPQFAGPGAADAPAAASDAIPEGGGLLGVAPDLRAPIEQDPFARRPSSGDPRGVAPLIRQAFLRQGIDPSVPLRVAQSEGLATFLGDAGKSGGAFQLYTGGGLGNEFQKQTGLDPLDPKNEAATIDWVAKNVNRTGWSPYHGAAKVGIGPRTGLPGGDLPPDEMIPSGPGGGGGRPPVMQAQYAPGAGAGGAPMPAAPVPGGVLAPSPGAGLLAPPSAARQEAVNTLLLELARRNAAAEVLGLGTPYNSLLGVLQGSPGYKGQITGAEEAAREPYRQIARDQELKNALTKEGWQINDKGEAVPVPLYNDVKAAQANAISIAQESPKLDSALAQQNKMRVYDAQGHVMIVPIPGGAETEAAGKGLTAGAEAAAKAPYETKDVRVLGPDGQPATETMTVAEFNRRQALQAKNAAMGATPKPGDIIGAPITGTVPEGYQLRTSPQGGLTAEPIPNTPAAQALQDRMRKQAIADQATLVGRDVVVQNAGRIENLIQNSNLPVTGTFGPFLSRIPGTPGNDARVLIDTIKSRSTLDTLNALRAASPTGGALGSVSDQEDRLLGSAISSLDQSQTKEQFLFNLRRVKEYYIDAVHGPGTYSKLSDEPVLKVPGQGQAATAPVAPELHPLMRQQASDALAKGAPRAGVIKRLQDMGVNTEGL